MNWNWTVPWSTEKKENKNRLHFHLSWSFTFCLIIANLFVFSNKIIDFFPIFSAIHLDRSDAINSSTVCLLFRQVYAGRCALLWTNYRFHSYRISLVKLKAQRSAKAHFVALHTPINYQLECHHNSSRKKRKRNNMRENNLFQYWTMNGW